MTKFGGWFDWPRAMRLLGLAIGAGLATVPAAPLGAAEARWVPAGSVEASVPATSGVGPGSVAALASVPAQPELFGTEPLSSQKRKESKVGTLAASSGLVLAPFAFGANGLSDAASQANGGVDAPSPPDALSPALILFIGGLAGLGFLTRGRKRRAASTALHSTVEL